LSEEWLDTTEHVGVLRFAQCTPHDETHQEKHEEPGEQIGNDGPVVTVRIAIVAVNHRGLLTLSPQ
jgi:hypothetical protein